MKLRITVSCDDCNPSPQYRILGTPVEKWMRQLNEEFGVRYTLFVPSCYHGQWPISEHKDWIKELDDSGLFELAAHGHYHMTSNPQQFGECEMLELDTLQKCGIRHFEMINEWRECSITPVGWRNPGWLCHPMWNDYINNLSLVYTNPILKYVAVHYEHNRGLLWKGIKTFFGHDGIQQENISIHNGDMIMFTSHVAGKHNHNVWNRENFEQLRLSLTHLFETYGIEPKFLRECL